MTGEHVSMIALDMIVDETRGGNHVAYYNRLSFCLPQREKGILRMYVVYLFLL